MLDNRKQKNVVVSEGVAYQHVPWESESCLSAHAKPETSPWNYLLWAGWAG